MTATNATPGAPREGADEWVHVVRFVERHARGWATLGPMFGLSLLSWAWAALGGHAVWWLTGAVLAPGAVWPLIRLVMGLGLARGAWLRRSVILMLLPWAVLAGAGLVTGWWAYHAGITPAVTAEEGGPALPVLVVAFGAGLWAAGLLLSRREEALLLPGVLLTWSTWRPIFLAGFWLSLGARTAAYAAMASAVTHSLWAMAALAGMMLVRGWAPRRPQGDLALGAMSLSAVVMFMLYLTLHPARAPQPAPLPTLQPLVSPTRAAQPSLLPTLTTATPTPKPTPTPSSTPSPRPSATPTPSATPSLQTPTAVAAIVVPPPRYQGIYLRQGPGFQHPRLRGLLQGTRVDILPDAEPVRADGYLWVRVLAYPDGSEPIYGWVLAHLIATVTPTASP
ncbi:MAG: SH3 domain-containing protein [Chloroflexi bacterium]|nr:SH3 domain-containing protein [Chloroflexota bacterium]